MHPTTIYVNCQQLSENLQAIRRHIGPRVKLCLPVKANAYGHGLLGVAKVAANYVDYLAVACLDEAKLLRANDIKNAILVFGAFAAEQIPGLVANDLEITISSRYKAEQLVAFCQANACKCKIHLKIDTGMNRIGVRVASAYALIDWLVACPELELVGIYSHLAVSDELNNDFTLQQITQFTTIATYAKSKQSGLICHLANSAGVCHFPHSYFDMVRPGLLSYGYFPIYPCVVAPLTQIKPCFSLITQVVYFKVVEAGAGISYGHRYITPTATRVVTLPIGYGDGYSRGLSNCGDVLIRQHKYKISGTICMDMLMIDIGSDGEAFVGDEVVLIGKQGEQEILIADMAKKLNTIIYEVLVSFNLRIPRVFN